MGFFDFFTRPTAARIENQVRKAKEQYAQPDYRRMAMDKLLKWGTKDSLKGLLERFCVVVQSPHWDEEEKRWLSEELIKRGDIMKPLLKEFIFKKDYINYALKAYRSIINDDDNYRELIKEALRIRPPSDHRSVEAKKELIAALAELSEDQDDELLIPYLLDHSDDVQCATIDALSNSQNPLVIQNLIKILASDAHSARVIRRAASLIEKAKIPLDPETKLSEVLSEDFTLQKGRLIRKS